MGRTVKTKLPPRVWDTYLTEQDKASLSERPELMWGFGERPALVLVDLYRWVFGDRPQPLLEAMKEWPGSCGLAAWESLPFIEQLLEAARTAKIPIVHITGLDGAGVTGWSHPSGRASREFLEHPEREERLRRRFEIIEQLGPRPGEAVLRKVSPSAFWGTPLVAHLHDSGVDSVIVCGESTSGCVRATVVDGRTNRFKVIVAEECVFDRHQAPHAINLFDMHQKYADVLPTADVLAHLGSIV